jgi:hypothetical protein
LGTNWVRNPQTGIARRMFIANIRLFATDGTAENGVPIYTVVVGAP